MRLLGLGGYVVLRRLSDEQKRSAIHWAMEFVVVVAGVLLALWLQQWDERRRARAEMLAAEGSVHDELLESLKSLIWRQAISKCHQERINLLQSKLLASGAQWQPINGNALFENLGNLPGSIARSVYHRPLDSFTDSAWTSALSTGALRPMDRRRFATLVTAYEAVKFLEQTRELEDRAATVLSPLGLPIQLTPDMRADMLRAVYDVDRSRFTFALINPNDFADTMRELGWNDRAAIDQWIKDQHKDLRDRGIKTRSCVAPERNPFVSTD